MIPGRTAAFSFEKSPMACAIGMAATHNNLRRPRAEALFR